MVELDRNLMIARKHFEEGATYREIADTYGISRSRAQQICDAFKTHKYGLPPFEVRKIHRTVSSLQSRINKTTVDLHAMKDEVADLERLLQATLFPLDGQEEAKLLGGSEPSRLADHRLRYTKGR